MASVVCTYQVPPKITHTLRRIPNFRADFLDWGGECKRRAMRLRLEIFQMVVMVVVLCCCVVLSRHP